MDDKNALPAYANGVPDTQSSVQPALQQIPSYIQQPDGTSVAIGPNQPVQQYPVQQQQNQQPQPQVVYVQVPYDPNTGVPLQQHQIQQASGFQPQYITEKGTVPNVQQVPQAFIGQSQTRGFQNATPLASIGRSPVPVDCPACGQRCMTRTSYVVGNYTHAWAGILCFTTWFLCWIPYVVDGMKNVDHHCGNCGTHLATWHRSGSVEVLQHN